MRKNSLFLSALLIFLGVIIYSPSTFAQTVTNGSVTGAPVGNSQLNNAAGWTVCGFSPDLCDTGFPSYSGNSQVAVSASPDGGSWLGMAAVGAGECAQTTITGLTAGNTYTLCFYGACFGTGTSIFNQGPSNPEICVGGTCQTVVIPQAANTWTLYTMTFTATAPTETLSCTLTGDNSYCGLDGFTISVPGATPDWTDPSPVCAANPPINLDTYVTGTPGGVWSGTGVTGNTWDPSGGSQSVTYTVNPGGCDEVSQTILINVSGSSGAWTPPVGLCDNDLTVDLDALVTGDPGGVWSGTGVTGSNFDPSAGTQNVTYTVGVAPCDDIVTQQITVGTFGDASWTLPTDPCLNAPDIDLSTLITGTTGGTWSGTGVTGNMFDPSVGSQNITYTAGTAPCQDVLTQMINVVPSDDPNWLTPGEVCESAGTIDLSTLITGTAGGTWTGTGVAGNIFDPAGLNGPISITYTVGAAPCEGTFTDDIIVNPDVDPAWTAPANLCDASGTVDLTTTITGTAGGTWSGTGVTGNMFDPAFGSQTVTYTVGTGACVETLDQLINVDPTPDPAWTTLSLCATAAPYDLNAQVTGTAGGTWSGTGVTGSLFDPSFGTQSITYTVANGACSDFSTQTITVGQTDVTVAVTNVTCFGLTDGSATATVTGGSGNYTYTWAPGGQNTATVTGLGSGSYTVTVNDIDLGCSNDVTIDIIEPAEITLNLTGVDACIGAGGGQATAGAFGGVGGFSYAWTPSGQLTQTAIGLDSAMHTVTATDANGCSVEDSIVVNVWPLPSVNTFPSAYIEWGDCVPLGAIGATNYTWEPDYELDCVNCQSPVACPEVTTTYCVTGTNAYGCADTACMLVDVEIVCGEVFVPSAFSPNGDNENDFLCVYSDCLENFSFKIYNRWGEKVYETSNKSICWDGTWKGKELNPAVFVYVLDGYLINGKPVDQKGNISLVR
ncbi:MAG: gliding motility-associated C-terminal domain-containing protein [Crocinitomicaceae bacterium]